MARKNEVRQQHIPGAQLGCSGGKLFVVKNSAAETASSSASARADTDRVDELSSGREETHKGEGSESPASVATVAVSPGSPTGELGIRAEIVHSGASPTVSNEGSRNLTDSMTEGSFPDSVKGQKRAAARVSLGSAGGIKKPPRAKKVRKSEPQENGAASPPTANSAGTDENGTVSVCGSIPSPGGLDAERKPKGQGAEDDVASMEACPATPLPRAARRRRECRSRSSPRKRNAGVSSPGVTLSEGNPTGWCANSKVVPSEKEQTVTAGEARLQTTMAVRSRRAGKDETGNEDGLSGNVQRAVAEEVEEASPRLTGTEELEDLVDASGDETQGGKTGPSPYCRTKRPKPKSKLKGTKLEGDKATPTRVSKRLEAAAAAASAASESATASEAASGDLMGDGENTKEEGGLDEAEPANSTKRAKGAPAASKRKLGSGRLSRQSKSPKVAKDHKAVGRENGEESKHSELSAVMPSAPSASPDTVSSGPRTESSSSSKSTRPAVSARNAVTSVSSLSEPANSVNLAPIFPSKTTVPKKKPGLQADLSSSPGVPGASSMSPELPQHDQGGVKVVRGRGRKKADPTGGGNGVQNGKSRAFQENSLKAFWARGKGGAAGTAQGSGSGPAKGDVVEVSEIQDNDDDVPEVSVIEGGVPCPGGGLRAQGGGAMRGRVQPKGAGTGSDVCTVDLVSSDKERRSGGGEKGEAEMTEEQLLLRPDMFLTKEQRKRKEQLRKEQDKKQRDIDATRKLLSDRAQRDSWAEAAASAVGFKKTSKASSAAAQEDGEEVETIGVVVVGSGGLKRPRGVASIFERSTKPAVTGSDGSESVGASLWRAMPAPFPLNFSLYRLFSSPLAETNGALAGECQRDGVGTTREGVSGEGIGGNDGRRLGETTEGMVQAGATVGKNGSCDSACAAETPRVGSPRGSGLASMSAESNAGSCKIGKLFSGARRHEEGGGEAEAMPGPAVLARAECNESPDPTPEEELTWKNAVLAAAKARRRKDTGYQWSARDDAGDSPSGTSPTVTPRRSFTSRVMKRREGVSVHGNAGDPVVRRAVRLPSPAVLLFAGEDAFLDDPVGESQAEEVGRSDVDLVDSAEATGVRPREPGSRALTSPTARSARENSAPSEASIDHGNRRGEIDASNGGAHSRGVKRTGGGQRDRGNAKPAVTVSAEGKPGSRRERLARTARARRAESPREALWTEVYRPRNPEDVCGNPVTVAALSKWLADWKDKRRRDSPGDRDQDEGGKGRGSDTDNSDVEWDYRQWSDDESGADDGLRNMTLLVGPSGVGKTSAIYGCATSLGYEVIEVNASQLRSGTAIRRLFGEATQSRHVSSADSKSPREAWSAVPDGSGSLSGLLRSPSRGTKGGGKQKGGGGAKGRGRGGEQAGGGVGKRGKGVRRAAGVGSPAEEAAEEGIVQVLQAPAKLSVILFEEVDIVFEEDVGFLGALRDLRRRAKCPIILTTDCYRQEHAALACNVLYMPRPRLAEMEACLSAVAAAEGMDLSSAALCALAQYHMGDLRRCLFTLQVCRQRRHGLDKHAASSSKPRPKGRRHLQGPPASDAPCPGVPCPTIADHVGSDVTASQVLAFDLFLPTLVRREQSKICPASASLGAAQARPVARCNSRTDGAAAPGDQAVTPAAPTRPESVRRRELPQGEGDSEGDGSAGSSTAVTAERRDVAIRGLSDKEWEHGADSGVERLVVWQPPIFNRWPEVYSVSPSSVPTETSEKRSSTGRASSTDSVLAADGDKARGSGDKSPPGSHEASSITGGRGTLNGPSHGDVEHLGHRVLISGRNFAHPCSSVSGSSDAPVTSPAGVSEEGPPGGGQKQVQQVSHERMREVLVRFGRRVVPGKVLSDTLVEAFAPSVSEPGFVEVVAVVSGSGRGGELASDSGISGEGRDGRRSVLFRYCALPPLFPPVPGLRGGTGGSDVGVKPRVGSSRRLSSSSGRDRRDSEGSNRASTATVMHDRYGPIPVDEALTVELADDDQGDESTEQISDRNRSDLSEEEPVRNSPVVSSDDDVDWSDGLESRIEDGGRARHDPGTEGLNGLVQGDLDNSGWAEGREASLHAPDREKRDPCKRRRIVAEDDDEIEDEVKPDGEPSKLATEEDVIRTEGSISRDKVMVIEEIGQVIQTAREDAGATVREMVIGEGVEEGSENVTANQRVFPGEDVRSSDPSVAIQQDSSCEPGSSELVVRGPVENATAQAAGRVGQYRSMSTAGSDSGEGKLSCGESIAEGPAKPVPYDSPGSAQVASERGMGCLLDATWDLAEAFSAADAIGGVCGGRGFHGAGPPPAQGGEEFVSVPGPPWPSGNPGVLPGCMEDEATAGPVVSSEGLPNTLWEGACCRYMAIGAGRGLEWSRCFLSNPISDAGGSERATVASGGLGGHRGQAEGLRGHCLAYCQRDRVDYIRSRTALTKEPSRCKGAAMLPVSLTLDRAPMLANLCAIELRRQEGDRTDAEIGARFGAFGGHAARRPGRSRFRHYLVRAGVVDGILEAESLGRMYYEPAW